MSQLPLRERQRLLREEAILDAAHALLAEKGYEGMSMDELAARVGIAKATMYQHFPSKEEVTVAVIVRMMKRIERCIVTVEDPSESSIRVLERTLREGLREKLRLWHSSRTLPFNAATGNTHFKEQQNRLETILIQALDKAKAEGYVDPSLSTPVLVRLATGMFRIDYEDLLSSGAVTSDDLITTLSKVILRGIKTKPDEKS